VAGRPAADWLELHIRALFIHDDRGRIVTRSGES